MDSNKGENCDNEDPSSISIKESIVEVGIEGENCLTVINDYEDLNTICLPVTIPSLEERICIQQPALNMSFHLH